MTIVWNDPVNLMSYVTYVFQKYFGYAKKKAEKLMMEVHEDGKSVVSTGTREEMERDVQAMHEYGLWATMERADMSGFARHRRSGRVIANFTGFEADLLRSLASQLVELLRNEAAVPREGHDPFEALIDFSGPDHRARGPGPRAALPDGVPARRGGGRRVPPLHRGHAARRQGAGGRHDHRPARGGRPPRRAARGRPDHRRRARRGDRGGWLRSFTDLRLALATRLGVEDGDEDVWLALPDEDPRAHVHDIYEWVGYLQETLVEAVSR